jgi:hypothetical protein
MSLILRSRDKKEKDEKKESNNGMVPVGQSPEGSVLQRKSSPQNETHRLKNPVDA